jgi:hypothetical protein
VLPQGIDSTEEVVKPNNGNFMKKKSIREMRKFRK